MEKRQKPSKPNPKRNQLFNLKNDHRPNYLD